MYILMYVRKSEREKVCARIDRDVDSRAGTRDCVPINLYPPHPGKHPFKLSPKRASHPLQVQSSRRENLFNAFTGSCVMHVIGKDIAERQLEYHVREKL